MAAHKYSLGLVGDGYAVSENGIVKIVDNQVYICDLNLADMAREFEGRWMEVAFCSPNPPADLPIDEKIKPLVDRLRARGVETISSCQGHMEPNYRHFPFVSTLGEPKVPTAPGWAVIQIGTGVWRVTSTGDAATEDELMRLQDTIADQVEVL